MKLLGLNDKIALNGKSLTVVEITKKGILLENGERLTLEEVENAINGRD